jgi:tripartite-type tricarboxylate transporter receptor subunit TctC
MKRRTLLQATAALSPAYLLQRAAAQQGFPNKPITLVVPYAAGGNGDFTARSFGEAFSRVLGQPVIVENRAGGGGAIGANYVASAKPDGYTLICAAKGVFAITPNVVKVSYGMENFKPIGFVSRTPMVLVVKKNSKLRTLEDFLAEARTRKLAVGIGAMGSDNHVAMLQLELATRNSFNPVAYRGAAPMLQDILGGQLEVGIDQLTTSKPFIESGDLTALAVLGTNTDTALPSVPTIAKIGAEPFDSTTYIGVLAPSGTPAPVLAILEAALKKAVDDPKLNAGFAKAGGSTYTADASEFETRVRRESDFIKKMIAEGKVQKE